jgi:DNA topoisomerase IA
MRCHPAVSHARPSPVAAAAPPAAPRRSATYCKNFKFPFAINGTPVEMIFTSVAGHLQSLEFNAPFNSWRGCRPADLYAAPVSKRVAPGEGENMARNLAQLARGAQWLVLWLDCDREGENIAFEVMQVCREANPRLVVKRARFSALIHRDILHAVNHLVQPNADEAAAVDARQEIDLRVGSSFTRLQTLLLQDKFPWGPYLPEGRDAMLLSYGPCQFPTLGLIVKREWWVGTGPNLDSPPRLPLRCGAGAPRPGLLDPSEAVGCESSSLFWAAAPPHPAAGRSRRTCRSPFGR